MLKQRGDLKLNEKDLEAYKSIEVGMTLYGYCCGLFGRDSYGDKVITRKTTEYLEVQEQKYERKVTNSAQMRPDDWYALVQSSNKWLEEDR